MKKFLLYVVVLLASMGAYAKPITIASIIKESYGDKEQVNFIYEKSGEDLFDEWSMGKLLKVTVGESEITFDYSQLSSDILTMTRVEQDGDTFLYEMTLNEDGNVVKVIQYENGVRDEDYVTFEYADERLINYKQIRGNEIEESIITYDESGHVNKVEIIDSGYDSENETILYEYELHIGTNQFGYLWDMFYNVDLDDFEWVAFSGYLGKPAKGLPSKITVSEDSGESVKILDWNTCVYGTPGWITVAEGDSVETFTIEWYENAACGVESIDVEGIPSIRFYDVNGVEVSGDAKGLVIERKGDGSTVKRLNR